MKRTLEDMQHQLRELQYQISIANVEALCSKDRVERLTGRGRVRKLAGKIDQLEAKLLSVSQNSA